MRFDPERSLFELPSVRWTVSISLFVSVLATAAILVNSELYFDPSYNGFNKAVEVFKVPLGILAVGLSLVGIYGANHRSEQTKRQIERTAQQIELTRSQNNFSNFYKHLEEFNKFCEKHQQGNYGVKSARRLHSQIYPKAAQGVITVDPAFVERVVRLAESFQQSVKALGSRKTRGVAARDIVEQESKMVASFNLYTQGRSGTTWNVDGENVFIAGDSPRVFVRFHLDRFKLIDEILSFDTSYLSPTSLKKILDLPTDQIPANYFSNVEEFTVEN